MNKKRIVLGLVLVWALILGSSTAAANAPVGEPHATLLASGLAGASGSTIGPDGALYVTEGAAGRIARVDLHSGAVTTFAAGLPPWVIGLGGAIDVAFIGHTAYALVTLVGPDVGGSSVVGIYRVDGPSSFTIIADIGTYSIQNPPNTSFFVPSGLQFALEPYRGGFLVTDGHHNRVLHVTLGGEITEALALGNVVPTGLARWGNKVLVAQAGPAPHAPADGKVVAFAPPSSTVHAVASGASLLVDVELGGGRTIFALSQGIWDGAGEGSPALPNTGALVAANPDGSFTVVMEGLNQPTSLEFLGRTAYVVTLGGEVWRIGGIWP